MLRVRKRGEFKAVYGEGLRVAGERLVIFVRSGENDHPRLGITATRKVGGAVVRNRLRRLVREVFRRNLSAFDTWDVVVNLRRKAVGSRYQDMEREMLSLMRRARKRSCSQ